MGEVFRLEVRPVLLFFRNPRTKMGHVVVGYGYRDDIVLYKDPLDGGSHEKESGTMTSATDVAGSLGRSYGQIPLPIGPSQASGEWADVIELTVDEQVSP